MNLHIANRFFFAGFEKRACRRWRERSITLAKKQILHTGQLRAPPDSGAVQGDGLGAFKLADHAEMVLQVLPDTAQFMHHFEPMRLDFTGSPTPLRSRICSELSAPADKITSLLARTVKLLPFLLKLT